MVSSRITKKIKIFFIVLAVCAGVNCNHEITQGQLAQGQVKPNRNQVTGTVKLAEGVKITGSGTLFVIARADNQTQGAPLAVVRIQDPVLPIGFTMSQKSVMIPGLQFEGPISLTAKFSASGAPFSDEPGDLVTSAPLLADTNTQNIELLLDYKKN